MVSFPNYFHIFRDALTLDESKPRDCLVGLLTSSHLQKQNTSNWIIDDWSKLRPPNTPKCTCPSRNKARAYLSLVALNKAKVFEGGVMVGGGVG